MPLPPTKERAKLFLRGYIKDLSIALCYQHGIIVGKNLSIAISILRNVIETGNIAGYSQLGLLYQEADRPSDAIRVYRLGIQKNDPISEKYLKQLARQNNPEANFWLGKLHEQREIPSEALKYYTNAATLKFEEAFFPLAELLLASNNTELALTWYKTAALINNPLALHQLFLLAQTDATAARYMAELYETNDSAPAKNEHKAREYYLKSCNLGSKKSAVRLAELHLEHDPQTAYDFYLTAALREHAEAITIITTTANDNNPFAQLAYFKYLFQHSNIEQAIPYLLKAADQKYEAACKELKKTTSPDACFEIAKAYEQGSITGKNIKQALIFYARASDHGNICAALHLAELYQTDSPEIPLNLELACSYYLRAASLGEADAIAPLTRIGEEVCAKTQVVLGNFFAATDPTKAAYWYQCAAEIDPSTTQMIKRLL